MCSIRHFARIDSENLIRFLEQCLPESGRTPDLNGRHKIYLNVEHYFEHFWILSDREGIIGTSALKKIDDKCCELKSLYLFKRYQRRGLGRKLLDTAIDEAKRTGYREMYLDTLSTSERAIRLYEKAGFKVTEQYNENDAADIFMVLDLDQFERNLVRNERRTMG